MKEMTELEKLKKLCEGQPFTINQLIREAGEPRDIIRNWKVNPKSFDTLNNIMKTYKKMVKNGK